MKELSAGGIKMDVDRFRSIAESVLESLPAELMKKLNGGILVLPEKKEEGNYLVMGEYMEDPLMGSSISLYYGSFAEDLKDADLEEWEEEIEDTIIHELRHHIESLAGVDYLSDEEMEELEEEENSDE